MNPQLAETINLYIDKNHSQEMWAPLFLLGCLLLLEIPFGKWHIKNTFDYVLNWCKVLVVHFVWWITFSQAIMGGCLVFVMQYWLAKQYGKFDEFESFHPWGIAFRDNLSQTQTIWLRVGYIFGFLLHTYVMVWYIKKSWKAQDTYVRAKAVKN
jgi:hypothetical protein